MALVMVMVMVAWFWLSLCVSLAIVVSTISSVSIRMSLVMVMPMVTWFWLSLCFSLAIVISISSSLPLMVMVMMMTRLGHDGTNQNKSDDSTEFHVDSLGFSFQDLQGKHPNQSDLHQKLWWKCLRVVTQRFIQGRSQQNTNFSYN